LVEILRRELKVIKELGKTPISLTTRDLFDTKFIFYFKQFCKLVECHKNRTRLFTKKQILQSCNGSIEIEFCPMPVMKEGLGKCSIKSRVNSGLNTEDPKVAKLIAIKCGLV